MSRFYSIEDLWQFTHYLGEGEVNPAYETVASYRRQVTALRMRIDTPADVREMLNTFGKVKQYSEDTARQIARALPGRPKEFSPAKSNGSKNTVGSVDESNLYSKAKAAQLTGLTIAQLDKIQEDGLIVPTKRGRKAFYSKSQVVALLPIKDLRGPKHVRFAIICALSEVEDQSRDFHGWSLAAYGTNAKWISSDSDAVGQWIDNATSKLMQGEQTYLIHYDEQVNRLSELERVLCRA